jgi:cytochrome b561
MRVPFTAVDKLLHWLMALLFLWQFVSRYLASSLAADHPAVYHLIGLHSIAGFIIFALGCVRIWRAMRRPARHSTAVAPAVALAAKANHAFLLAVMLVQPVTGYLAVGEKPGAETAAAVHNATAYVILVALAVHIAAALWHHFVQRDDVLRSMLPARRGATTTAREDAP